MENNYRGNKAMWPWESFPPMTDTRFMAENKEERVAAPLHLDKVGIDHSEEFYWRHQPPPQLPRPLQRQAQDKREEQPRVWIASLYMEVDGQRVRVRTMRKAEQLREEQLEASGKAVVWYARQSKQGVCASHQLSRWWDQWVRPEEEELHSDRVTLISERSRSVHVAQGDVTGRRERGEQDEWEVAGCRQRLHKVGRSAESQPEPGHQKEGTSALQPQAQDERKEQPRVWIASLYMEVDGRRFRVRTVRKAEQLREEQLEMSGKAVVWYARQAKEGVRSASHQLSWWWDRCVRPEQQQLHSDQVTLISERSRSLHVAQGNVTGRKRERGEQDQDEWKVAGCRQRLHKVARSAVSQQERTRPLQRQALDEREEQPRVWIASLYMEVDGQRFRVRTVRKAEQLREEQLEASGKAVVWYARQAEEGVRSASHQLSRWWDRCVRSEEEELHSDLVTLISKRGSSLHVTQGDVTGKKSERGRGEQDQNEWEDSPEKQQVDEGDKQQAEAEV